MKLLLDTGILGPPRKYQDVRDWLARVVEEHDVFISEVAD